MAKKKTNHAYELELRRLIKERTGEECALWIIPQVRATALNLALLDKMHETIMSDELTTLTVGSTGQQKNELNPLLPQYDKMQRTLLQQFQALGLNYNATPGKMTESTKRGIEDDDPMAEMYRLAVKM